MGNYDDIINLPHKQSSTRPHMAVTDRAAQFAPFAALVGYDDAVRETARLTGRKHELSEGELEQLNIRINFLMEHLSENPEVNITFFQADERKSGGAYLHCAGTVKKIDEYEQALILSDGKTIFFEDIQEIESPSFPNDILAQTI